MLVAVVLGSLALSVPRYFEYRYELVWTSSTATSWCGLRVPLRAGVDLGEHDRDGAPHRQEPAAVRQPRLRHRLPHHRLVSAHLRHPDAHSGSTQRAVDGFRNEIIVSRWTIVGEGMLVALNEIARFRYYHHPAFHSVSCHLPPRILSASAPYQLCQRALVALNDGRHVTQSCRWISK